MLRTIFWTSVAAAANRTGLQGRTSTSTPWGSTSLWKAHRFFCARWVKGNRCLEPGQLRESVPATPSGCKEGRGSWLRSDGENEVHVQPSQMGEACRHIRGENGGRTAGKEVVQTAWNATYGDRDDSAAHTSQILSPRGLSRSCHHQLPLLRTRPWTSCPRPGTRLTLFTRAWTQTPGTAPKHSCHPGATCTGGRSHGGHRRP